MNLFFLIFKKEDLQGANLNFRNLTYVSSHDARLSSIKADDLVVIVVDNQAKYVFDFVPYKSSKFGSCLSVGGICRCDFCATPVGGKHPLADLQLHFAKLTEPFQCKAQLGVFVPDDEDEKED